MEEPKHKHGKGWLFVLSALGIVYGDIGTSPLYALRECFNGPHAIDISVVSLYGVLSLIFWSMTLVISIWYLQFIMRADNHGEGGILALAALACLRPGKGLQKGRRLLLVFGLFGAALLVGDGMITPAISVLSAIEGLQIATPVFEPFIHPITIVILVGLFSIQRFGTSKIGGLFGPIMVVWFLTLAILGLISLVQSPEILLALSPHYALSFIWQQPHFAFLSLGAIFLVVTGGEALYADMGHFGRAVINKGWFFIAMPALLLNYLGQGALILRDPSSVRNPFYLLAPEWATIPLVILATLAAVIASQAVISGLFSVARQCVQLGFCPRLEIVHTSSNEIGQIYVPPINWACLAGTITLVLEFGSSSSLAAAYGIAVSVTMLFTSILALAVARSIWKWPWKLILPMAAIFPIIDMAFLSANSLKIWEGGWVPLVIAGVVYVIMTTWKKGREILIDELRRKSYPFKNLLKDLEEHPPVKVPGCAVYMVGDAKTTPPALLHNLKHNKVLHEKVIFLTIVTSEISKVPRNQRLDVEEMAPGFFRVIGHFGFSQTPHVPRLLKSCRTKGYDFSSEDPTYFLGREIVVSEKGGALAFWQKKIFAFLSKNARPANCYFALPLDRVVELGMQVKI